MAGGGLARPMQLRSIVDRRENELAAMQNGRSWVKKRNLGQKNETLARKTGFSAPCLSVSIERGGEIREIFSAWQTIILRHTGDSQKTVLLGTCMHSTPRPRVDCIEKTQSSDKTRYYATTRGAGYTIRAANRVF